MQYNWKKILLYILSFGLAGGLNPYLQSVTSGHPVPFTFGTIAVPAITAAAGAVIGLFSKQPTQ